MPVVTGLIGFVVFAVSAGVLLAQEFTQGFETPSGATRADDRWALWYLDVLPIVLVSAGLGLSFAGVGVIGTRVLCFAAGIVFLWCGVAIRQWSHITLGQFHDGLVTVHERHEIVESGPYRFVRHPMYAGSALAFLGIGLALGTWPGLVICFVGTLPAMIRRIGVEERALRAAIGAPYEQFCEGRARMLPGVW